jgi:hypothetical protein
MRKNTRKRRDDRQWPELPPNQDPDRWQWRPIVEVVLGDWKECRRHAPKTGVDGFWDAVRGMEPRSTEEAADGRA